MKKCPKCNVDHAKPGIFCVERKRKTDMIFCSRKCNGKNLGINNVDKNYTKPRISKNHVRKLTDENVLEIYFSSLTAKELCKKFNITKANVYFIKKKKNI